jgi:hypothetical protein
MQRQWIALDSCKWLSTFCSEISALLTGPKIYEVMRADALANDGGTLIAAR